jgi:hypothetical protein
MELKVERYTTTREEQKWAWAVKNSPQHRKAIDEWTGEGYSNMRKEIAGGKPSEQTKLFLDAVAKAPNFEGTTYRGMRVTKQNEAVLNQIVNAGVGSTFTDNAPFSMSRDPKVGDRFAKGGVLMKIKSKTGARIESVMNYADEKEVLSRPGAQYKITQIHKKPTVNGKAYQVMIEMEEL